MTIPYSFPRYLTAKKPIDDRALNQPVWDTMTRAISPTTPGDPLRILEIGCGIGTMYERLMERGLPTPFSYTGIDSSPENIAAAHPRFAFTPGTYYSSLIPSPPTFLLADLFSLPPEIPPASFDLLLVHAVLDLLDLPRALPHLFSYLRPGGVFYFTLNFDGETIFQPEHPLDPLLLSLYHRTMDERHTDGRLTGDRALPEGGSALPEGGSGLPEGGSRTGRHLFTHLKNAGADILAAGSSDWVVFPGSAGYPGDEAYFLHHILHFFEQSLTGHPELPGSQLSAWLATRRTQIETRELIYLAHQLDFVGKIVL